MGWILQCFLWVTLMSTSAYNNYRGYGYGPIDYYGGSGSRSSQLRRLDYGTRADYTEDRPQERTAPTQRMNERSISVTSGIQRVQEKERRRVQSFTDETLTRSENGTYKIVNSHPNVKYPTISTRQGISEDPPIVFPGKTSAQKFEPIIPKECQEIGICEKIPNYPHDVVDKIIAKLRPKLDLLKIEELEEPEIAQRIGPDDNAEIDLCNYREAIVKPEAAKGKDGSWYVILNNRHNPLQGYRVEICHKTGQSCAENIVYFYGGYTAVCKQKYVQRTVLAVDVEKEDIFDMPFRVPSCCSCVAMHTGKK